MATRRLRETLALATSNLDGNELSQPAAAIQRAGDALGKTRDADVVHELLVALEDRLPAATPVIAGLRRETTRARRKTRRGLIKEIERLDLDALPRQMALLRQGALAFPFGHARWRAPLRAHVAERAADLRRAVERASGVYFPNRSHAARLATKKLRYALELAQQVDGWRTPRAIRRLRKAQEALGQAHDREMLLGRLRRFAQEHDGGVDGAALESLVALLENEILSQFGRYLTMRSELLSICDACEQSVRSRRPGRAVLAAGAAVPALMLLGRRTSRAHPADASASGDLHVNVRMSKAPLSIAGSQP